MTTKIKIHLPIILEIKNAIQAVFEQNFVADKEVNKITTQHKNWGARDRNFFSETFYDIVRWKLKYEYIIEKNKSLFNNNNINSIIIYSLINRNFEIINPEILSCTTMQIIELISKIDTKIDVENIEQSYPKELYDFCENKIGNDWKNIAKSLNQKSKIFIRANENKCTNQQLLDEIKLLQIDATLEKYTIQNITLEYIEIHSKNNLKKSDLYKNGFFDFQDIGSQLVSKFSFLALAKNENTILDLCAGAGGKSLHLSSLLKNKDKIFATDFNPKRLEQLKKRIEISKAKNIQIINFDDAKKIKNIDLILIDAPCSGTGTFKRQADLKYKITIKDIEKYEKIQAQILEDFKNLSHKIVYATCSILPQENQLQIENFLKNNTNFYLENEIQLLPNKYNGDGFYMALLCKKN